MCFRFEGFCLNRFVDIIQYYELKHCHITLPGSNVLLLRNSLSCGVHLLYALLCGRPVVVLAEPRNERFVS